MTKIINKIKENKRLRYSLVSMLLLLISLIALIYNGNGKKILLSTAESVDAFISELIDGHQYQEIPWDVFMVENDKKALHSGNIPTLPSLDIVEQNVNEEIGLFSEMLTNTETYLTDYNVFEQAIDDIGSLNSRMRPIYGNDKVTELYMPLLKDVYSNKYNYPESLNLVSVKQSISKESIIEWTIGIEMNVLQDKDSYIVHPITLKFDETHNYLDGKVGKPRESQAGTRPLTIDALISDDSHLGFLNQFEDFAHYFDISEEIGKTDSSHLPSLVTDTISIDTLESIFEASRGNIKNGSITSWSMDDNNADAMSYYYLDVPYNAEGDTLRAKITYSRAYDSIKAIELVK